MMYFRAFPSILLKGIMVFGSTMHEGGIENELGEAETCLMALLEVT
jgi:hypothetical protein